MLLVALITVQFLAMSRVLVHVLLIGQNSTSLLEFYLSVHLWGDAALVDITNKATSSDLTVMIFVH